MHRATRSILAAAVTAILFVVFAAPSSPQPQRFGKFTIDNFDEAVMTSDPKTNNVQISLTGPKLFLSSPQYDMAAPRIQVTLQRTLRSATGSGGVTITMRRPEAQQTTTVTAQTASFVAATTPQGTDRIDLKGTVRSVTRDPAFVEPLVQTSESGVIELLGDNRTRVTLRRGSLSVTPRETAAGQVSR